MATMTVQFASNVLKRSVPVQVILPADKNNGSAYTNSRDMRYPTLYLLHGLFGCSTDWLYNTRIRRYAEDYNLAVVMPSGDNSFYADLPQINSDYGRFIGEELVDVTRRMFPLSYDREATFIGGLSMGGFGALRNGLAYADTFGYVIALSAAIHFFEYAKDDPRRKILIHEDEVLGDYVEAAASLRNPAVCLKQLEEKVKAGQAVYPKVFQACGTEDSLIEANRFFGEKLRKAGVPLTCVEEPGAHEWDFWDRSIRRAIETWLPLGERQEGTSSGHVVLKNQAED